MILKISCTSLSWHFSGKSPLSLRFTSWVYISTWMRHPKRQERILLKSMDFEVKQLCDLQWVNFSIPQFPHIWKEDNTSDFFQSCSEDKWINLSPRANNSAQPIRVHDKRQKSLDPHPTSHMSLPQCSPSWQRPHKTLSCSGQKLMSHPWLFSFPQLSLPILQQDSWPTFQLGSICEPFSHCYHPTVIDMTSRNGVPLQSVTSHNIQSNISKV